uniref:(northern house mosquito) hypothetical protein n=1 Tax=Culex pipiens TaxID=7175 RepID=A0A8D8HSJ9_CULPI
MPREVAMKTVLQVQSSDLFGPLRDELLVSPRKVGFYTSTRFLRFPVRVDSGSGPVLGEGYRRMLGKTSSATITGITDVSALGRLLPAGDCSELFGRINSGTWPVPGPVLPGKSSRSIGSNSSHHFS